MCSDPSAPACNSRGILFFAPHYFVPLRNALLYFVLYILPRFSLPLYYLPLNKPGPQAMTRIPPILVRSGSMESSSSLFAQFLHVPSSREPCRLGGRPTRWWLRFSRGGPREKVQAGNQEEDGGGSIAGVGAGGGRDGGETRRRPWQQAAAVLERDQAGSCGSI
jgi:hypothetical protein